MFAQIDFPPVDECPPINLAKQYEVRYWSNRLKVSPDQLRAAIAAVGNCPADVEQHLASASVSGLLASLEHAKLPGTHA